MTRLVAPRHGTEHVVLKPDADAAIWWSAYAERLGASGIGTTSRDVIGADARFIVDHGIFGVGEPGNEDWPASRERRGLVMGAVQSGKTASMMAVAALALDRGVDALVILGGTRTTLWVQTLERVLDQLDTLPEAHKRRVRMPGGPGSELEGSDLDVVYSLPRGRAEQALKKGRPLLVVAMKNTAHLERLSRRLHDVVYPAAVGRGRAFHLLVIDDEADDSSVVDAATDSGDVLDLRLRQVPRRILDLWEVRNRPGETAHPEIFATYLAYTATPQANFLQDTSNPLAPTDFVASLRTPGATGDPDVRESSYRVPEGPRGWYTGGEVYYKALADVPLCLPTDDTDQDDLVADGVRSYLVASALRLLRTPGRLGPTAARGRVFTSKAEVQANVLSPMSMLVNPAATKDSHFEVADRILDWSYGTGSAGRASPEEPDSFGRVLGTAGIKSDMHAHRDRWTAWLDRYRAGAAKVATILPLSNVPDVPDDWDLVRATILDEVVPGTGVAVINSDERADDRPQFSPRDEDGVWRAPTNSSTIFVSGNVMSRGLTLEGLTTTLFTRNASTPLADTQMQMQRWFGYRGAYIDLCRVLMPRDQIELFTQYHENDEALRRDVLTAMGSGATPDLTILQGRTFRATGKIANLQAQPLFPGPKPFISHMNPPGSDDHNLRVVADLFSGTTTPVPDMSASSGLLLAEPVSLLDAAEILDRIRYVDHGPGAEGYEAARWRSVTNHAQIADGDPVLPLYRAPSVAGSIELGSRSPYEIAAYLRLWDAVVPRRVPGLMTTDDRPVPWNLVDREALERRRPRFWVGLRFGSGDPVGSGPLADLSVTVRPMRRAIVPGTSDLHTTWGSRNDRGAQIMGDEVFERAVLPAELAPRLDLEGRRLPGSDGLILFHVIAREDGSQSLGIGLGIPLGGPDHIRARTGAST
ncbi:Z1 domain-containing protein [Antribacter sp. KLBMP9083]|uniref:Z1 domain-containing protein n=1 Tax=Antribacter soli TaxID=2910976 RepID=A0AA41QFY4_9MICO|nr:Z1 domain-containing protein [Antribacter soli]MCF4122075.1 Z1 domain-containing protein [Antribacter soli]